MADMGNKSSQKKNMIIGAARSVFAKRGYRAVTMKDIVEACGISRGGLYLYFSDTKELFEALLEQEAKALSAAIAALKSKDINPGEALLLYLESRKKDILKKKDNLTAAFYEYLFENGISGVDNPARKALEENAAALEALIEDGVSQEWMTCENPHIAAKNIACAMCGMRIAACTTGITEKEIDSQIEYIMGTLGMIIK